MKLRQSLQKKKKKTFNSKTSIYKSDILQIKQVKIIIYQIISIF